MKNDNYIPRPQDIVILNFDPSSVKEIQKRRPALVMTKKSYNQRTGLIGVVPITNTFVNSFVSIPIQTENISGFADAKQFHTFDYTIRKATKIEEANSLTFVRTLEVVKQMFAG
ncbi:MAG: type II toxin-antitoxin system PemK/MazF family toxin [Lactobacillaceae bacterium]|jgi:mRNA interferase MazF|nr:type II toxin-antitoxin system PemK/MazF family toxin [Lactobacillaceae bacterium]